MSLGSASHANGAPNLLCSIELDIANAAGAVRYALAFSRAVSEL